VKGLFVRAAFSFFFAFGFLVILITRFRRDRRTGLAELEFVDFLALGSVADGDGHGVECVSFETVSNFLRNGLRDAVGELENATFPKKGVVLAISERNDNSVRGASAGFRGRHLVGGVGLLD
jgi:hypothetical protein